MRCPICNARVKNEDALQIHYIESCEGVGNEESPDPRSDDGLKMERAEPVEDLVEVVFRWINTKDTVQQVIVLITSLAGQIQMKRSRNEGSYKSATVIVPCGVHSCQLVVDEECYAVVDVDINPASETVYIVLQEDYETDARGEAANQTPPHYFKSSESTPPIQTTKKGAWAQDEITPSHARKLLEEIQSKHQAFAETEDERTSMLSHDSNCETMRVKRREKQLEELAKVEKENLTEIAKSGLHQVQIHTNRENDVEDRNSQKSYRQEDDDLKLRGSERYGRGSIPERLNESRDGVITPPNGFQTTSDSKYRNSTRRHKTLSKIAKSKISADSLSDQGSVTDSLNERKVQQTEGNDNDSQLDEKQKYSWGFEEPEEKRAVAVYRDNEDSFGGLDKQSDSSYSRKLMTYKKQEEDQRRVSPTSEEMIADLIKKCDEYKAELEKAKADNEDTQIRYDIVLTKSQDQDEELQNKDEKIEELQAKCDSYETELERMKNEISDITNDFGKLQEEIEVKREEVAMLEARLESILQDNKTVKEENESLQTANKLQREDMDRIIQDEVEALKSKFDSVKVGTRSFQYEEMRKIRELQSEVAELNEENKTLKKQLSRIKREVNSAEKTVSDGDEIYSREASYGLTRERPDSYVSPRIEADKGRSYRKALSYSPSDNYEAEPQSLTLQRSRSEYHEHNRTKQVPERSHHVKEYSDRNHNSLLDDNMTARQIRDSFSKRHGTPVTSGTSPLKASHFDYMDNYNENLRNSAWDQPDNVDTKDFLRKERRPRRERPRSYHGMSASESDSRHMSRNLAPFEHEQDDPYIYTVSKGYPSRHNAHTTSPQDHSTQHLKPFAPNSIDDILIGMKVLITRSSSSGRIGKGVVKWKGRLAGHNEQFIGIELEAPNGKHDGIFDNCRYFYCKKDHGVFTKFSKIVMVWGST
ncbi:centrosome-associated protein 350-like isoform X2 [Rhopilema esculentum]|uniref:centrosome-associated protein 350-like isoform X2 n=1 Tax=Rhopilema esculentum TaxID=499914 RepID=UPI0031D8C733